MAAEQRLSKRVERELNQTRVIIRHLPPEFDREAFLEAFSAGLPEDGFSHLYVSGGDADLGPYGCARAYVNFPDEAAVVTFRDRFDGMTLESKSSGGGAMTGKSYRVLIEYAPFQGLPKPRKKPDARCGTVEQDADFRSFMASREEKAASMPAIELETYLEESKANHIADVQVTPLITYLRNKRTGTKSSKKKQVFVVEKKKKKSGKKEKELGKKERRSEDREKRKNKDGGWLNEAQSSSTRKDLVEPIERKGGGKRSDAFVSYKPHQNGKDAGAPAKERLPKGGGGGGRRPDRAIYTPKLREQRERSDSRDSSSSSSSKFSKNHVDTYWDGEGRSKSETPRYSSEKHHSGGYRGGRGRGRGRGGGGRGRGKGGGGHYSNSHDGPRTAAASGQ